MHDVGHDVLQKPLVVRDEEERSIGRTEPVHAIGNHLQSVDIQSRIGLVEHRKLRFEHEHLKDLIALFLAAGESLVDAARQEALVHVHDFHFLAHQPEKLERVDLRQATVLTRSVDRGFEQIDVVDPRDLHRILKSEEQPRTCTLFSGQREQILSFKCDRARGDLVSGPPREHMCQRALSRTVRSHDCVDLARRDLQVQPSEDLLAIDCYVQVLDAQHDSSLNPPRLRG